jgi:sphingolipid delta-4 desaturase
MSSSVSTATITAQSSSKSTKSRVEQVEEEQASLTDGHDEHDRFFWTYTEEPHKTRRQAIIKAHPEVCSSMADGEDVG